MSAAQVFLEHIQSDPGCGLDRLQRNVLPYESVHSTAEALGDLVHSNSAVPQQYAVNAMRLALTLIRYMEQSAGNTK